MNQKLTTCAGDGCCQRECCLRCVMTEEHEVTKLCYSGLSFFKPVPKEDQDD